VKEEPYPVREVKVGLRGQDDDVEKGNGVFKISFEVETAKLRNVEFKIISEVRSKVGVNSALFEVLDGTGLMGVHLNHCLAHVYLLVPTHINIQPLFESLNKSLFGYCLATLTDEAATEQVVKATTGSKETTYGNVKKG
jgi:hypothetical protein